MRGRSVTSYLPLFPGYLFLLAERDECLAALSTGRAVRSLEVADQNGLWSDLRQLHKLIGSGSPILPEERLVPGAKVEIANGPLAGMRGTVLRAASGRRFVVSVHFIHRGASVLLPEHALITFTEELKQSI